MKKQKGDDRAVFQSLAMVMQFGLNMIVPICMMSALGIWIDGRLGTFCFTILFFVMGAAAGGQNIYRMVKKMCATEEEDGVREISDEDGRSDEEDK